MQKYKITVAYDGTLYSGWQVQPHSLSIQEVLQKTLKIFLREEIQVIGSGRTDAGVHALGQVAHFSTSHQVDLGRFLLSANALLPPEIRIRDVEPVSEDFHAQYSTKGKEYHYHLSLGKVQEPFHRLYSYHFPYPINLDLLQDAAKAFLGKHDFTTFANSAHLGSASRNPVRTLKRLDVVEEEGGVRLEFEADGFLYRMVRNITGTLLDCAGGRLSVDAVEELFQAKDRKKAPQAAPPQGLFLMKVFY